MLDTQNFLYVEWILSFHCNYNCTYCFWHDRLVQDAYMYRSRGPRLPRNKFEEIGFAWARKLGLLDYADAFRNAPLEQWLAVFDQLAKDKRVLYLSLTGGEPLLHHKKLNTLIEHLLDIFEQVQIRVDTNGSVIPKFSERVRQHVTYNVSYHPSYTTLDKLLEQARKLNDQGRVHMLNRIVQTSDDMRMIADDVETAHEAGFYLNVSPANFDVSSFQPEQLAILQRYVRPKTFDLAIHGGTAGKNCGYATFGFQLLPNGWAWIPPCDNDQVVNVLRQPSAYRQLLKPAAIACPGQCVCFHQYPWVVDGYRDLDIMGAYVADSSRFRDEIRRSQPPVQRLKVIPIQSAKSQSPTAAMASPDNAG